MEQRLKSEPQHLIAALVEKTDTMSPKQRKLANYILENPGIVNVASARELAAQVGVDPATVVRFAQALGFRGYVDLQQQLRHSYLASLSPQALTDDQGSSVDEHNVVEVMLQKDLSNLRVTLETVDKEKLTQLADRICEGRCVLVIAEGSYIAPALILSHHCQAMGYPVHAEGHGGTRLAAALTSLRDGDVVFGLSFWRGYQETIQSIKWARARGLETFALTDSIFSPIARAAEHTLIVPTAALFFFNSLTASTSLMYGLAGLVWLRGGGRARESMEQMRELYREFGAFSPWEGTDG